MFLDDDDFDESPDKKGKGGSSQTGGGAKSSQSSASSSTSRPGTGVASKDGERVEANFREKGRWYGGKITRDRGDNTYDIAYDFGESESRVSAAFIRFNSNGGGSAPSKSSNNNSHFDSKPSSGGGIDDIPMIGSQAAASSNSNSEQNSRARMLALEREKAQKARTLDSTRMMRRSEELAESSTSAPSQTTPAFRQFSAPKSFVAKDSYADKSDDEEETFKPKPKDVDNSLRRSSDRDREREREREREIERERQRNEDNRRKDNRFDDESSSRGKGGRDKRDYRDDSDEGESPRHKDGERRSNSNSRSGRDHDEDGRGGADRDWDRDRSSPRSNNEKSPRGGDWDRSDSSNVPKGGVRADRDRSDRGDRGGSNSESSPRSSKSKDADKDANTSSRWESGPISTPSPAPASAPTVAPLNLSDIKRFLCSPVPKANGVVQCYIRRNKNGANKLFPVYSLYLKENDRFLLASKKRANNRTSNYLISMSETDLDRDSANYLGKLRSNFIGTEFQIYDDGANPEDVKKDDKSDAKVRKELAAITYTANLLGTRGPRKMQVAIPSVDESEVPVSFRDGDPGTDILSRIKEKNFRDLAYLINKPPRWNEQVGAYVLNFNGRVTMASVKNFQLVDPDEQNAVVLQFGRVDKDEFTMDLQWPMSPLQAFGITMSSFDSKIACD